MTGRPALVERRLGRHLARCHLVPQVPKIQLRVAKESEFLRKIPSKVLVYVLTSPDHA